MESADLHLTPAMYRILDLLKKKPNISIKEMSEQAFIGVTTLSCAGYLRGLRNHRLVHISGWRNTVFGFRTALYSLGDSPDVPRPKLTDLEKSSSGLERILEALKINGPLMYREVADATGLSANTVKNARMLEVLTAQGLVHISEWRRNKNGPMAAVYSYGSGKSAIKPAALPRKEISRRHREKTRVIYGDRSLSSLLSQL